uniref:Uncharacterized protein n=1 Tax=Globisporangium ultimum (strain ATCC 200006 / CBS 805.95 / DAOM BR144) TaxID=431595 RepID=K3X458_GLOUD
MTGVWFRTAIRAWESIQVELHGTYSVERMYQLKAYSESTSLARVIGILVLPSRGLGHSHTFWIRALLAVWIAHLAILGQLRQFVVEFPITRCQVVIISLLTGAAGIAFAFWMACQIGFPLPFMIAMEAPVSVLGFTAALLIGWGHFLQENPHVRTDLVTYVTIVFIQLALIYVYPAFSFAFRRLTSSNQTAFALFLPVMKLAFKNCISYVVRHMEDSKPQVVIFNIEIFHAFYVTATMQNATSMSTILLLMSIDMLQNWW